MKMKPYLHYMRLDNKLNPASRIAAAYLAAFLLLFGLAAASSAATPPSASGNTATSALWKQVQLDGHARVVVGFRIDAVAGPLAAPHSVKGAATKRLAGSQARSRLLTKLDPATVKHIRPLNYLPYLALEVNAAALTHLEQDPRVTRYLPGRSLSTRTEREFTTDRGRRRLGGRLQRCGRSDRHPRHRGRQVSPFPDRQSGLRGVLLNYYY